MAGRAARLQPVDSNSTPLRLNLALEDIAERVGAIVKHRRIVRLPVKYKLDLEAWIKIQGMTGKLTVDYSQGTAGSIMWEESQP